jgi:DNA-nicking Smr family endonuclease
MTHIHEIDLHGMNMSQSRRALDSLFDWLKTHKTINTLHIVVGVGNRSLHGPVLPSFVINYLKEKGLTGENVNGVIKVNLKVKK